MTKKELFYFFSSLMIVACAQPDWSVCACIFASCFGYALFWKGMLYTEKPFKKFIISFGWFAVVQAAHLSWFTSDKYVGCYIFLFLAFMLFGLAAQFGLISLFIKKEMSLFKIIGVSGSWALFEWLRLFFLSGYSWDPVGLGLSSTTCGMQMASVAGVFGLSFWIFLTNLFVLRLMNSFSWRTLISASMIILTPYIFGLAHLEFHKREMQKDKNFFYALLVQTSLSPEEKIPVYGSDPLSPHEQWIRILSLLSSYKDQRTDLIVLSESAVPYGANCPIYEKKYVDDVFEFFFGKSEKSPACNQKYVGNIYWVQSLSNQFSANVLIGLEDYESARAYNAAFLISPNSDFVQRYEKRVLVPIGEYIPCNWVKKFLIKHGIKDFYTAGNEAKILHANDIHLGVSICYEETHGNLVRECRCNGCNLLVNLSNDAWYPRSRLPIVHFLHGRLRSVESGLPLIRSCNTGVTCAVDSLGRTVNMLKYECSANDCQAEVLSTKLSRYCYQTIYNKYGNFPIIIFAGFSFAGLCLEPLLKRKALILRKLDFFSLHKK